MYGITVIAISGIVAIVVAVAVAVFLFPGQKLDDKLTAVTDNDIIALAINCNKNIAHYGPTIPLYDVKKTLRKALKAIENKRKCSEKLRPYETILLNNKPLIYGELNQISKSARFFEGLIRSNGTLRIYSLGKLLARRKNACVDKDELIKQIRIFNENCELTTPEIENLGTAIRFCLIEYLGVVCQRIINGSRYKKLAKSDAKIGKFRYELLFSPNYTTTYYEFAHEKEKLRVDKLRQDNGVSLIKLTDQVQRLDCDYHSTVSSVLNSLSSLNLDDEFVIKISPVSAVLDELHSYEANSIETKRAVLRAISKKAKRKNKKESVVALRLVSQCKAENVAECDLLFPYRPNVDIERAFIFMQIVVSGFLILLISAFIGANLFELIPSVFIILVSVEKISTKILNSVVGERFIPSIADKEINSGALIVKSAVITSPQDAEKAIFDLLITANANESKNLYYSLLVDLPTAKTMQSSVDENIVEKLKLLYEKLDGARFNIFVRKRSQDGEIYRGKNKRRGAISALNSLILDGKSEEFLLILGNSYRQKFVISINRNTVLLNAEKLIAYAQHPYSKNYEIGAIRPFVDGKSANSTLFGRIFAQKSVFSPYFNLFSNGSFSGEGIYEVKKFEGKFRGFFERNSKVNFGFAVGKIARTVELPSTATTKTIATFNDFLLEKLSKLKEYKTALPYLNRKVKTAVFYKVDNPLRPTSKWQIITKILDLIQPIFSFALIMLSALFGSQNAIIISLLPYLIKIISINPISAFAKSLIEFALMPSTAKALIFALFSHESTVKNNKKRSDNAIVQLSSAIILLIINLFLGKTPLVFVIISFFAVAPALICLLDEKHKQKSIEQTTAHCLNLIAERTWRFFEHAIEQNVLPPLYYDERSSVGYSEKTGASALVGYVFGICCAHELGIISKTVASYRLDGIISQMDKLEKYRGNFYQNYAVKSRVPSTDRMVSLSENGLLITSLLLCRDLISEQTSSQVQKIIDQLDVSIYLNNGSLYRLYQTNECRVEGKINYITGEYQTAIVTLIALKKLPQNTLLNLKINNDKNDFASMGGGVIDYLLAQQFFDYSKDTIIAKSAKWLIKRELNIAKKCGRNIFGISKCYCNQRDSEGRYLLKEFSLWQKSDENYGKVVSLYGGMLMLNYKNNAEVLVSEYADRKLIGIYGLYECVDKVALKLYSSLSQGIIMLSIANYLNDSIKEKFSRDARFLAVMKIIENPTNTDMLNVFNSQYKQLNPYKNLTTSLAYEEVYSYSAGNYSMVITSRGRGFSSYHGKYIYGKRKCTGMLVFANVDECFYDIAWGADCTVDESGITFKRNIGSIIATVSAFVNCLSMQSETRKVTLINTDKIAHEIALGCFCEINADLSFGEKNILQPQIIVVGEDGRIIKFNCESSCAFPQYKKSTSTQSAVINLTLLPGETNTLSFVCSCDIQAEMHLAKNLLLCLEYNCDLSTNFMLRSKILTALYNRQNCGGKNLSSAIGNDYSIIALTVNSSRAIERVDEMVMALSTVAKCGIAFNIAILYAEQKPATNQVTAINNIIERREIKRFLHGKIILVNVLTNDKLYQQIEHNAVNLELEQKRVITPYEKVISPYPTAVEENITQGFNNGYYTHVTNYKKTEPLTMTLSNEKIKTKIDEFGYCHTRFSGVIATESVPMQSGEFIVLGEHGNFYSLAPNPYPAPTHYGVSFHPNEVKFTVRYNGLKSTATQTLGKGESKFFIVELENLIELNRTVQLGFIIRLGTKETDCFSSRPLDVTESGNALRIEDKISGEVIYVDCSTKRSDYAKSLVSCCDKYGKFCKLSSLDRTIKQSEIVYTTTIKLAPLCKVSTCFCISKYENLQINEYRQIISQNYKSNSTPYVVSLIMGLKSIINLYPFLPRNAKSLSLRLSKTCVRSYLLYKRCYRVLAQDEKAELISKIKEEIDRELRQETVCVLELLLLAKACFRLDESTLGYTLLNSVMPQNLSNCTPFSVPLKIKKGKVIEQGNEVVNALFKTVIDEEILGVNFDGEYIEFNPHLPLNEIVTLSIESKDKTLTVTIDNRAKGEWKVSVGKIRYSGTKIKFSTINDGAKLMVERA